MASKAQAAKEKGNAAFKSGDYVAAVGHYTEAILADKHDPTFFLNRAAAYLKLGKYVHTNTASVCVTDRFHQTRRCGEGLHFDAVDRPSECEGAVPKRASQAGDWEV